MAAEQRDALALATGSYWTCWPELRHVLLPHAAGTLLHRLPRDVLKHISAFAHRPRSKPVFELREEDIQQDAEQWGTTDDEIRALTIVSNGGRRLQSFIGSESRKLRVPWSEGFQYLELSCFMYCGTEIVIQERFRLEIAPPAESMGDDELVVFLRTSSSDQQCRHIGAWQHSPNLVRHAANNTLGLLFNFEGGANYVILSMNGVVGPRLELDPTKLPTDGDGAPVLRGKSREIEIDIYDNDARGPDAYGIPPPRDEVSFPPRVPMRMADPELHGLTLDPKFDGMCRGGSGGCPVCNGVALSHD